MEMLQEVLYAAVLAFAASSFLLRKQITNEMRENLKAYERGRVDEAGRREHEFELLNEEVKSLRGMESKRQLIATTMPVYNYFIGLVRNNYDVEGDFPGGESATLAALLSEDKRNEYVKLMLNFDKFQIENFKLYELATEDGEDDKMEFIKNLLVMEALMMASWFNNNVIA